VTAIDLCCGMGGLTKGLLDAGIEVVLGVDEWADALKVCARNLGVPTLRADLARLPTLPQVDVICGGPPCQDFSSAGNRREGERAGLTVTFARIVADRRPEFVLYENVPSAARSKSYREGVGILRAAGYGLTDVVLDSSLYGVPQRRKRLILLGHLGSKDDALRASLIAGASSLPLSVRDYCGSVGLPLALDHYFVMALNSGCRSIWSVDEPAPTLRRSFRSPLPPRYEMHPGDATQELERVRPLTLREASLIQTFPAGWDWCDVRLRDGSLMLANSVPPRIGQHLGLVVLHPP
jgi:DNA (cytosine-5)-methyltransferase 1